MCECVCMHSSGLKFVWKKWVGQNWCHITQHVHFFCLMITLLSRGEKNLTLFLHFDSPEWDTVGHLLFQKMKWVISSVSCWILTFCQKPVESRNKILVKILTLTKKLLSNSLFAVFSSVNAETQIYDARKMQFIKFKTLLTLQINIPKMFSYVIPTYPFLFMENIWGSIIFLSRCFVNIKIFFFMCKVLVARRWEFHESIIQN